jgi:hypothetical protein
MAKRYTDSEKWKRSGFQNLSNKMKLVWVFLLDNCDHAGIWEENYRLLSYHIGEQVTKDEILTCWGHKIDQLPNNKLLLKSFIPFQYGVKNYDELNPNVPAVFSVLKLLFKENLIKALPNPSKRVKDKDKDKDKNKDSLEGGPGETKESKKRDDDDDTPPPPTRYVPPEAFFDRAKAWAYMHENWPDTKKRDDRAHRIFHDEKTLFRDVLLAFDHYLRDVAQGLVGIGYIMLLSSFVEGRYKEYLEPNWPQKIKLPKKLKPFEPIAAPVVEPAASTPEEIAERDRILKQLREKGIGSFIKTVDESIEQRANP